MKRRKNLNFSDYWKGGLISLLLCICTTNVFAQGKTVKGTVMDGANIPVIGANVIEKGTTNGTITDLDGAFTLEAPTNTTFIISYIGYIPQEIKWNGKNPIKVILKEDTKSLDEVIVVGYGTQAKKTLQVLLP